MWCGAASGRPQQLTDLSPALAGPWVCQLKTAYIWNSGDSWEDIKMSQSPKRLGRLLKELALRPNIWSILGRISWGAEKNVSLAFVWSVLQLSVRSIWFIKSFTSIDSLFSFVLTGCVWEEWVGTEVPHSNCAVLLYGFRSSRMCTHLWLGHMVLKSWSP